MLSRTASTLIRRQSRTNVVVAARSFAGAAAVASRDFASSVGGGRFVARRPERRSMSSSHDDFAPVQKAEVSDETDEAIEMIREHVTHNPVMLYMKGNPSMPMCGFSAKMVQTLQAEGIDFSSVNVLDYPSIREGIKKFASWPTIPQLYVNGEFIGGTDIVAEMQASGELKDLLAEAKAAGDDDDQKE
mmetsp:Transcript_17818/g.41108  ORF Transcript_17818/g.41108 Transcript_17818/m.41108 type:complete len:188 (+) Transcript_17818:138-701(+)|eukprot:CAMPEP_0197192788 /NCGR_PEP_ID=MMETSP1423-20130617/25737_1 /TAXON_ID=476441 /ORGANISM="Pseudo-nitzschia heimii, Strain UNC1101" /LENGTH=187 /DNA_ID=CAMNT_0042645757 /DNA_START=98 /DNA_END=661 /DNA_ORIENTATION=+